MWNHRDRQDVTVIWRLPMYADVEINSGKLILDLHDTFDEKELTPERVQKFDKIFVKSTFHRSLFPNIPDEKFVVVPNGIDATLFEGNGDRDPRLLINTSSADRSMEAFLDCFEEIKKQVPGCEGAVGLWLGDFRGQLRAKSAEGGMEGKDRGAHQGTRG